MTLLSRVYAALPDDYLAAVVERHLEAIANAATLGSLEWHAHAADMAMGEVARRRFGGNA